MFDPPLLNSANPWATTIDDLRKLYNCPYTGAVTTRTNTLGGFAHNGEIHQYCFFDAHNLCCIQKEGYCTNSSSSLNTLGYSPLPLSETIKNVETVVREAEGKMGAKAFILSVTGTPEELQECHGMIVELQKAIPDTPLYMEVNLSCPNITGKPPPSYSVDALKEYLLALKTARATSHNGGGVAVGIKTPPYSNPDNFKILESALLHCADNGPPITFISATNTLGCSLVLDGESPALHSADGLGIGGMAGAALHPLALGNVKLLRQMLDSQKSLEEIYVIGIGGVSDAPGYHRMKSVEAAAVGVGTAFGRKGIAVFKEIWKGSNLDQS
jgi:dihydroorotate dehydrogenase (fumarate)